jgi:hypothetical protein
MPKNKERINGARTFGAAGDVDVGGPGCSANTRTISPNRGHDAR